MAKKEEVPVTPVAVRGVQPHNITEEMRKSYIDYAMTVITGRALPDARDGLKPVHRRILYAMRLNGLTASARFRKSATVVGDVLGSFHPHGDSSVYDAMVKMAQDFSMRYPLVLGQGNFGSIDGDNAAAYRYTEAKMSKLSEEMLRDLEKDTVNWNPNFDGTKKEPAVLPAAMPNLLLNGVLGIAVGMATNIPPHNLRELLDATTHLIDNPEATTHDLLAFVKGPDFPLGAIAFNQKDIAHAYTTGKGGVTVRGQAEIIEDKRGNYAIIITSIPYRVVKATMIEKIADLVRDKKIEGIRDLRDESTTDIRVVIELKQGANPQTVLNKLYKLTQLEEAFHYNMVALVDGVPQTLSLKSLLEEFVKHREVVVQRRTAYDLAKAQDREHILLGLKLALDHIDEIIKTIRASKDVQTAHAALMKQFKFSPAQANAILEMRLQTLAALERQKIEEELKEKRKLIAELQLILKFPKKIVEIIIRELKELKEKFPSPRRTKVVASGLTEFREEDLTPQEEVVVIMTEDGYIKRMPPVSFRAQKRGGKGLIGFELKEEDRIRQIISANTHDNALFFTNRGRVFQTKVYEVPVASRTAKGKSVHNFLTLPQEETVLRVICYTSFETKRLMA